MKEELLPFHDIEINIDRDFILECRKKQYLTQEEQFRIKCLSNEVGKVQNKLTHLQGILEMILEISTSH